MKITRANPVATTSFILSALLKNKESNDNSKVVQYKQYEFEKTLAQHFLQGLNRSNSVYGSSIDVMKQRPISQLNQTQAATEVYPQASSVDYESAFYNGTRQQGWARELLIGLNTFLQTAITTLGSAGDVTSLNSLKTQVESLLQKVPNLVESDFILLASLPKQICRTVLDNNFTETQKATLVNDLCTVFWNQETVVQIFADARVEGMLDVFELTKSKFPEEELATLLPIGEKILQLKEFTPNFTVDDFAYILSVSEELSAAISASSLDREDKLSLCEQLTYLYRDQAAIIDGYNYVLEAAMFVNQYRVNIFKEVAHMVTSIARVFAPIDLNSLSGDLNSTSVVAALQSLRALQERFKDLTDKEKQLVNTVCSQYQTFAPYLGIIWAYTIASAELASRPFASQSDINASIQQTITANSTSVGFNLFDQLIPNMQKVISGNGIVTIGSTPYIVYSQTQGTNQVTINLSLLNMGSNLIDAVQKQSNQQAETLARAYFAFKADAMVNVAALDADLDVVKTDRYNFKNMQSSLYLDQLQVQAQGLRSMPLPSATAMVLVERFMPKEVDFLSQTKDLLYYSNLGSSVGNALIEAISYYVNGATYFNFASYVGQESAIDPAFSGSAESAQKKLNAEKSQAAAYLENTKKALQVIADQEQRVRSDPVITNEQRTRILDKLQKYRDNLRAIGASLVVLMNLLSKLSVIDNNTTSPGTFTVSGGDPQWQEQLEILEETLISGMIGSAVHGGMFPLQAMVQADQQAFADMGQNYQLELQMHLTSMQQEWTVVATSLQLLNQIYLNLSRSLMD